MAMYTAHCIYGYFGKDVPVFVDHRLELMPYAQAGVRCRQDGNGKWWYDLISYESLIFSYCPFTNEIDFSLSEASPDYSRTTMKHVGAFCKEYVPGMNYHGIKRLYYENTEGV